jgi:hypothetical protein
MSETKAGQVQIIEDYSCLRTILLASICRAKHHSIIERLSAKSGAPPHLLVAEVVTQLVACYAPTNVETKRSASVWQTTAAVQIQRGKAEV